MTLKSALQLIKKRGFKYCKIRKKGSAETTYLINNAATNQKLLEELTFACKHLDAGVYELELKSADAIKNTASSTIQIELDGVVSIEDREGNKITGNTQRLYTEEELQELRGKWQKDFESEKSKDETIADLEEEISYLEEELQLAGRPAEQLGKALTAVAQNIFGSLMQGTGRPLAGTPRVNKQEFTPEENAAYTEAAAILLTRMGLPYFCKVAAAVNANPGIIDMLKQYIPE